MAASFPASVAQFTTKVNLQDTVYAAHVNALQDEVLAVQNTLTQNILGSSYSTSFSSANTTWTTLQARLLHIEGGLSDVFSDAVRKSKGNTLTPPSGSVALSITSPGGSANLLEAKVSGNTKFKVDSAGKAYHDTYEVLYADRTNNASYKSIKDDIDTHTNRLDTLLNPLLLIG